jgi:hypothetical protein
MKARVLASMAWMGVMAAGASAAAQDRRVDAPWRVSVEVGGRWHHDRGLDAFGSTRSPPLTGLSLGRDLVGIGDRATLALDLNWNAEDFQGRLRDALKSRLTAHSMSAGLSLRVRTWWWLEPYARVAAGALYSDMLLTPESDSTQGALTGDEWTFMGNAGLGVQVTTPALLGTVRAVVAVEGGYQLALSQEMRVHPKALSDEAAQADRLPVADTALGTLNQSGGYLRLILGMRF